MLPVSFNPLMWLTFQGLTAKISFHGNLRSYDGYSPSFPFLFSIFFTLSFLLQALCAAVNELVHLPQTQLASQSAWAAGCECITPLNHTAEDVMCSASWWNPAAALLTLIFHEYTQAWFLSGMKWMQQMEGKVSYFALVNDIKGGISASVQHLYSHPEEFWPSAVHWIVVAHKILWQVCLCRQTRDSFHNSICNIIWKISCQPMKPKSHFC